MLYFEKLTFKLLQIQELRISQRMVPLINSFQDMIPEMELIASSTPEDFYRLLEHVQMRIHHYNQQNSQRQIE